MKTLHGSGISTNTIDNNEVSTNVAVQTTCMPKTRVKQNKTNVSPSSYIYKKIKWYVTDKKGNIKANMDLGISRSCGSAPSQEIE